DPQRLVVRGARARRRVPPRHAGRRDRRAALQLRRRAGPAPRALVRRRRLHDAHAPRVDAGRAPRRRGRRLLRPRRGGPRLVGEHLEGAAMTMLATPVRTPERSEGSDRNQDTNARARGGPEVRAIGRFDPLRDASLYRELTQRYLVWDAYVGGERRV